MLSLRKLLSFLSVALICLVILPQKLALDDVNVCANFNLTRVEMAVNFLINCQFNASLSLCREAPNVAPNTYWLVSDNLWAWKALKMANEAGLRSAVEAGQIAELIKTKLKESAIMHSLPVDTKGLPISFMHEAVIGDNISIPDRDYTRLILQSNDYVLKTEVCNGTTMHDWQEYADRLLFMALSCHWQGNDTNANYYFGLAKAMWDGTGINDTATNNTATKKDGVYATYKLALLLYASKILGEKLAFEFELVNKIWSLQRETDGGIITGYFANGTSVGDANTETTSIVIISIFAFPNLWPDIFAFYYPWYGTPEVSGYWHDWNDAGHNPDNFMNGRRDIASTDYPLLDVYDSNNECLIKEHINMAKQAGIDGFVVSWWGINSFEDNASLHIKNVCEQENFKFTFYYEITSSVDQTLEDILYILDNYANSSAWYKIDGRPVIYIYCRARDNLIPQTWKLHGYYINESKSIQEYWMLFEDIRKPPRYGIFPIHPYPNGIGYIENVNPVFLPLSETYALKVGISDIRNDSEVWSDVGFRIKIRNETLEETLYDEVVNFTDGWLDLTFDISKYDGQNVYMRAESYDGGKMNWSSEWAAVDYLYIENSKGEVVSPEPFFDNGWKTVARELKEAGHNPYFIIDFTVYERKIDDFAEYFLNFTDGLHMYAPCGYSDNLSKVFEVYTQASHAAHFRNKIFMATVMPGYDDTKIRDPGSFVDRQNGTYYTSYWSIATASFPDGYLITSFNEWHEGTEIEPSYEYGYQYINLTRDIVPEFPNATILAMFMMIITSAAIAKKKLNKSKITKISNGV